jgi:kumamolisin
VANFLRITADPLLSRASVITGSSSSWRSTRPQRVATGALPGIPAIQPFGPADIERHYNFPAGDAAGQKIAIAAFGGGYLADDVRTYCNKFQRPVPNIEAIAVDAPRVHVERNTVIAAISCVFCHRKEVMMDVEIVAGLCPQAKISVYFSTFNQQGWVDLLSRVILDRPVVLSIRYGFAEDDPAWSSNAVTEIDDRLNAARLPGITTCVSSGDDGSGDQVVDEDVHLDFPASSPNALGVGGTMLVGSDEVAWWISPGQRLGGGAATCGGVSTVFDRPGWQQVKIASLNSDAIDGRVTPDVAALAGDPKYDLVFSGTWYSSGGTSAAAPLWAALIARINQRLPPPKQQRFITPLLYQDTENGQTVGSATFRDVTVGNNISNPLPGRGYKAGPGFDAVSGWGVPDGVKLMNALAII